MAEEGEERRRALKRFLYRAVDELLSGENESCRAVSDENLFECLRQQFAIIERSARSNFPDLINEIPDSFVYALSVCSEGWGTGLLQETGFIPGHGGSRKSRRRSYRRRSHRRRSYRRN